MADLESNMPKASIGNYKGVMLCNRPNEFGQVQKAERQGKPPFISRVDPKDKIGLNPSKKVVVVQQKKKDSNSILTRHKKYLRMLQEKKIIEKVEKENNENAKQETFKKVRDQTAKQRQKIMDIKNDDQNSPDKDSSPQEETVKVAKLTKENLQKNDEQLSSKNKASKKADKAKPLWAKTEDQLKQEQDQEIDDLIEFAYDLDYEKYMEDLEVRQALALIKERVDEIKKDNEWRQKATEEWNQNEGVNDDAKSATSYKTGMSGKSKISKKSEIMNELKREEDKKDDWDSSTQAERKKQSIEEKLASKLADQILELNPNLKGIHSKTSMKRMLEKEAARQLIANDGGNYQGPKVAVVKDREMNRDVQASNLPYLHKNPAI